MATLIRVQASMESGSLLPEDACVNVWHWWCLAADPADAIDDIHAGLDTFYAGLAPGMTVNTFTGNIAYKYYDLSDPEPRSVIATRTSTGLDVGTGDGLPTECSICLSFGGAPGSGLNPRRRNGRVYLGPWSTGASTTITGFVNVASPTISDILGAAESLVAAGGVTAAWSVFSPTTAGAAPWDEATLEAATTWVTRGFVDNAFDTQRRRGTAATTRGTF